MRSQERPLNKFVSKADTLRILSSILKKSTIANLHSFTESEWDSNKHNILQSIQDKFHGKTLVVRSSALSEDTEDTSNAGSFRSILNVDGSDKQAINDAVVSVIDSYREKGADNPQNPVLVQEQTLDAASSGTVLTRDYNGSPYLVINYSEADTSAVTSGRRSKAIKILRSAESESPTAFKSLVAAVQEIEQYTPPNMPLDVEFAVTNSGDIVTFQVRPLIATQKMPFTDNEIYQRVDILKDEFRRRSKRKPHLAGGETLFGDMPDWNPAEIIGNSPHLLAASLYDEIITDSVWHEARSSQGYADVGPAKLVVQFGNKPYVDVRNTFNSFVPADIPTDLKEKLLDFYLNKLKNNPQLQDKVEFEILFTCYDFSFDKRSQELLNAGFQANEVTTFRDSLLSLTNNLLNIDSIQRDIQSNEALEQYRQSLPSLDNEVSTSGDYIERAMLLLDACKKNGTVEFSRLARLGFIGKTLLKSLVEMGAIDLSSYHSFLESISTVASDFGNDLDLMNAGGLSKDVFLQKYGHLRPGTYDITIPRYDVSKDYFDVSRSSTEINAKPKTNFEFTPDQHNRISELLTQNGLKITSQQLFDFVRAAIEGREYSKFLFTKSLSDAIEAIASAGQILGISRQELSQLDISTIKSTRGMTNENVKRVWNAKIKSQQENYRLNSYISLPPVLFSERDLSIVSYYEPRPNYITTKKIKGDIVLLSEESKQDITGKVVVIESADPGYDWVFAKKPAALITKYGGPASHMAIRCAELGLPAIIGAGDALFESLVKTKAVVLDCENQTLESNQGSQ